MTGSHLCTRSLMSTSPTVTSPHQPAPFATLFAFTAVLLLCLFHLRSLPTPRSHYGSHFNLLQPL